MGTLCESQVCENGVCTDRNQAGELYCMERICPVGLACFPGDPPVCRPGLDVGEACSSTWQQCKSGLTCPSRSDPFSAPDAGTCRPLAQAGEDCYDRYCADGLNCVSTGMTACRSTVGRGEPCSICRPTVGRGEPCTVTTGSECELGLYCLGWTHACGDRSPLAGPCATDDDCEGGLYCADESKTCRGWKDNGEPCTRDMECRYSGPCDNGFCNHRCSN
jgi:hypothetical protein